MQSIWNEKYFKLMQVKYKQITPGCVLIALLRYNENRPPVLLISIDGFRADYMLRNETPVLQKLADCGVSTEYMSSIYPTLTFPNHYSIVTVSDSAISLSNVVQIYFFCFCFTFIIFWS